MTEKKDLLADTVVMGFILSMVSAALYGITDVRFFAALIVVGIIPFCIATVIAILGILFGWTLER